MIGYPALDPRNTADLQNRIFGGIFNVKRLQPGKLREPRDIRSFGHPVAAVTHDSSTLGGNSGSAVVDVGEGHVVALHFAGRYLGPTTPCRLTSSRAIGGSSTPA